MVNGNTVIVNRPRQTADRLEKTTNPRSPQMQKCDNQEMDEDYHQTPNLKIYQIQNCGTVYMDSSNAHGVRMENCSNSVPQVTCSFVVLLFLFPFSSNLAISYYSDHPPRIIDNETVSHSQCRAVSDGMWALAPSAIKHVEYVRLPLGPQNATGPPTAPTEIAKSNVHLQTSAVSPLQCPEPMSPAHCSGDHTQHLEQLLDSSLATVAVIQFSGITMADVLTPRAHNTIRALYALAALDAAASSSTKTRRNDSEILTRSTFSDKDNDYPYSSNLSSHLPMSRLAVPRTVRMHGHWHTCITVDYIVIISWAGLVAGFCVVVFFNFPWLCERIFTK